jgi:hypothetical protein
MLFKFPEIGRLEEDEARAAIVRPAQELGVGYTNDAAEAIVTYTDRYPYFLQNARAATGPAASAAGVRVERRTRGNY